MRIAILSNHQSGKGRAARLARTMQLALHEAGHACWQAETSADERDPRVVEVIRDAELVVVCGGDGSLRTTVRAARAAGAMLWHAPAGTENLFARHFGMGRAASLVRALQKPRERSVDVWSADGHAFLVMASVGLDADIVHEVAHHRVGPQGRRQWIWPILRRSLRWAAPVCTVMPDDGSPEWSCKGTLIAANLPAYATRMNPVVVADGSDGQLDALAMRCDGALGLVPWALRGWLGWTASDCTALPEGGCRIGTDRACVWQVDGCPLPGGARSHVLLQRDEAQVRVLMPA